MPAPGQKVRNDFPRFGLPMYSDRFPSEPSLRTVDLMLEGEELATIDLSSNEWAISTIEADFHCVTTWTYLGLTWSGIKLIDVYKKYIQDSENNQDPIKCAVLHAQDGYKTSLMIEDLLASDVILATALDGEPLSIKHGAPVRLVAPKHYGYKNIKHITKIVFYRNTPIIKHGLMAFLDHPRARVEKEERSRWFPGVIVRYLYRVMIKSTENTFRTALLNYQDDNL